MLQSLRFPTESSRGRRYPEPGHSYRNAFQRDRDRIVHSRAFRRLEHKTQVFAPTLSDHFRNRLTHTIEVAQIARTAASVLGLNEDLTEALALVHDVGHPPFAHAGEEALNSLMGAFGETFDHNVQSLRTVDSLERRYPRFPGLNLTFEVREGIVKHSRDFAPGEFPALDEYLPGLRPPLEAQLIDLADEIAYNTADLDDAFEAGLLLPTHVAEAVPAYAEILETVETQFPGASDRERFLETLRELVDDLVGGLIEGTVAAARTSAIDTVDAVRANPSRIAQFAPRHRETSARIKRLLHGRVYSSVALELDRQDSMARLGHMFEYFMNHPAELPGEPGELPLHRRVCDFIAGMTDRYFLRVYQDQVNPQRL
ncbi:MAG: dNTP triphosphohydrolase [Acidobacteriota bacterium]|nr:dNTP triphosphohydrolase [Acidobacteriota bacterium]